MSICFLGGSEHIGLDLDLDFRVAAATATAAFHRNVNKLLAHIYPSVQKSVCMSVWCRGPGRCLDWPGLALSMFSGTAA